MSWTTNDKWVGRQTEARSQWWTLFMQEVSLPNGEQAMVGTARLPKIKKELSFLTS